jgi:DNA-directed RNA polymerase subunit M/transcription elongation factor TFIIS
MTKYLSKHLESKQIEELENEIYTHATNKAGDSLVTNIYLDIVKLVTQNLNPESDIGNSFLITRVKSGEVELLKVPYMTYQEMFPEKWSGKLQRLETETRQCVMGIPVATTSIIKCDCGSDVYYKEVQARSSDESMSLFIKCPRCFKSFNMM